MIEAMMLDWVEYVCDSYREEYKTIYTTEEIIARSIDKNITSHEEEQECREYDKWNVESASSFWYYHRCDQSTQTKNEEYICDIWSSDVRYSDFCVALQTCGYRDDEFWQTRANSNDGETNDRLWNFESLGNTDSSIDEDITSESKES